MNTKYDEVAVYEEFLKTGNKTATGEKFGCSARTVGRIVAKLGSVKQNTEQPEVNVPPKKHYFGILDESMINITVITLDNSEPPVSEVAYAGTIEYENAKIAYEEGRYEDAFVAVSKKEQLKSLSLGKVTVDVATNSLKYSNGIHTFQFPNDLCDRVIQTLNERGDVSNLMNFANRLANNPSRKAINELYGFLKAADIEIDADGLVICYKRVRGDYKDVYTGTIDNSVGQTVTMPRHMVDSDSQVTCSTGLHVAAKSYLRHYSGEKVVLCAVDPADFVSIPVDWRKTN